MEDHFFEGANTHILMESLKGVFYWNPLFEKSGLVPVCRRRRRLEKFWGYFHFFLGNTQNSPILA